MAFFPDIFTPYIAGREMGIAGNRQDQNHYDNRYNNILKNLLFRDTYNDQVRQSQLKTDMGAAELANQLGANRYQDLRNKYANGYFALQNDQAAANVASTQAGTQSQVLANQRVGATNPSMIQREISGNEALTADNLFNKQVSQGKMPYAGAAAEAFGFTALKEKSDAEGAYRLGSMLRPGNERLALSDQNNAIDASTRAGVAATHDWNLGQELQSRSDALRRLVLDNQVGEAETGQYNYGQAVGARPQNAAIAGARGATELADALLRREQSEETLQQFAGDAPFRQQSAAQAQVARAAEIRAAARQQFDELAFRAGNISPATRSLLTCQTPAEFLSAAADMLDDGVASNLSGDEFLKLQDDIALAWSDYENYQKARDAAVAKLVHPDIQALFPPETSPVQYMVGAYSTLPKAKQETLRKHLFQPNYLDRFITAIPIIGPAVGPGEQNSVSREVGEWAWRRFGVSNAEQRAQAARDKLTYFGVPLREVYGRR